MCVRRGSCLHSVHRPYLPHLSPNCYGDRHPEWPSSRASRHGAPAGLFGFVAGSFPSEGGWDSVDALAPMHHLHRFSARQFQGRDLSSARGPWLAARRIETVEILSGRRDLLYGVAGSATPVSARAHRRSASDTFPSCRTRSSGTARPFGNRSCGAEGERSKAGQQPPAKVRPIAIAS